MIILLKVIATIGLLLMLGLIVHLCDDETPRYTVVGYKLMATVDILAVAAIWIEDMYRCVNYLFT